MNTSLLLPLQKLLQHAIDAGDLRIVLASASPRRLEALQTVLGIPNGIEVITSTFHENLSHSDFITAQEYSMATAREKAQDVCQSLCVDIHNIKNKIVVIAADTVVELNGKILEKPSSPEDARRMLHLLSGQEHNVHTSVLLYELPGNTKIFSFTTTTKVQFAKLTNADITAYIATGEPLDKSGAYGIQGIGRVLVTAIHGDFFNVTGFPCRDFTIHFAHYLKTLLQQ